MSVEMLFAQILNFGGMNLKCGIVDQDVELAEVFDCAPHRLAAECPPSDVSGNEQALPSFVLDGALRIFGVLLLAKYSARDISAFPRKQQATARPIPESAAGDKATLSLSFRNRDNTARRTSARDPAAPPNPALPDAAWETAVADTNAHRLASHDRIRRRSTENPRAPLAFGFFAAGRRFAAAVGCAVCLPFSRPTFSLFGPATLPIARQPRQSRSAEESVGALPQLPVSR